MAFYFRVLTGQSQGKKITERQNWLSVAVIYILYELIFPEN